MVFPERDWIELVPESRDVDSTKLQQAVDYIRSRTGSTGVRKLVIARDGYVLWKGSQADSVQGVWSITKAFTNAALGLLSDDGRATLDTVAHHHVPSLREHYPAVTLRHFASMTSGYRAVDDVSHGQSGNPFEPDSPLFTPPGTAFAYWDSALNEYAYVLTRIADESLGQLFERRIAGEIGMNPNRWHWENYTVVSGVTIQGGAGNGPMMNISASELARFGHLILNRGRWNGRQLLSEAWVAEMTAIQVPATVPLASCLDSPIDARGTYGFGWWVNGVMPEVRYDEDCTPYTVPSQRKWPDAPAGTLALQGYNNNRLFVIPEWQMVIVRLGLDEDDGSIPDEVYNTFLRMVGDSIRASGIRRELLTQ